MKAIIRVQMDVDDIEYDQTNNDDCRNCPNFYLRNGHLYWCEKYDKSIQDPLFKLDECSCSDRVYLNGDVNSSLSIKKDSELYKFLENNHYIIQENGIDKVTIYEETLEDLLNCDEEFSKDENTLIGNLIYHLEYNGGYLFY